MSWTNGQPISRFPLSRIFFLNMASRNIKKIYTKASNKFQQSEKHHQNISRPTISIMYESHQYLPKKPSKHGWNHPPRRNFIHVQFRSHQFIQFPSVIKGNSKALHRPYNCSLMIDISWIHSINSYIRSIWGFSEMGVPPVIIHFSGIFHLGVSPWLWKPSPSLFITINHH